MHQVHGVAKIQIKLNLRRKELEIQFPLAIDDQSQTFCFRLPISQLSQVYKTEDGNISSSLIIPFDRPPQFFVHKKPTMNDDSSFPSKERIWSVWSTLHRETDVVDYRTRREMQMRPLVVRGNSAIIDIGRSPFPH